MDEGESGGGKAGVDTVGVDSGGVDSGADSILDKSSQLSDKVAAMADAAERLEEELQTSEDTRRRLETQVASVQAEKGVADQLAADLQASAAGGAKSADVANRLVNLADDVRRNKLSSLQSRREVQSLKEEKRSLETKAGRLEDQVADLEEARAEAETRNLLAPDGGAANGTDEGTEYMKDAPGGTRGDVKLLMQLTNAKTAGKGGKGGNLRVDTGAAAAAPAPAAPAPAGPLTLDDDDTLGVAQSLSDTLARTLRQQLAECNERLSLSREEAAEAEGTAGEYLRRCEGLQRDVEYFKAAAGGGGEGGGGNAPGEAGESPSRSGSGRNGGGHNGGGHNSGRDAARMAEAAHTTISFLKSIIEEKNRVIDKYKRKLADSKELGRRASTVGLVAQVEEAALLISDKDSSINSLELKLRTAEAARERAEFRCGGALEEMERMKSDLVTLAAQLQESEERVLEAMEDRSAAKKIGDLHSQLKSKEAKMTQLRQAAVRLKQVLGAEERGGGEEAEGRDGGWEGGRRRRRRQGRGGGSERRGRGRRCPPRQQRGRAQSLLTGARKHGQMPCASMCIQRRKRGMRKMP